MYRAGLHDIRTLISA